MVALVCLAGAALLGPGRLLRNLPPQAEAYRARLEEGLTLVRLALVAVALLAGLTAWLWPGASEQDLGGLTPPRSPVLARADWWVAAGLLALAALPVLP